MGVREEWRGPMLMSQLVLTLRCQLVLTLWFSQLLSPLWEWNENCASYNAIKLTPFTKIQTFFSYLNAAWLVASLWFISRLPEKLILAMFTSVLIVFTDFRESLLQHFKMFSLCLYIYKLIQLNKMRHPVSHLTLVMFLFETNLIFLSGLLS